MTGTVSCCTTAAGSLRSTPRSTAWPKAATALDLTVPPQSVQLLLTAIGLPLAWLIGAPMSRRLAFVTVLAQSTYLVLGLARLGRSGARVGDLLHAPAYILWKGSLYLRVVAGRGPREWTRGHRNEGEEEAESGAK